MYIKRTLQSIIESRLNSNKVILIFGARRVGKTILIKEIIRNFSGRVLILNGEDSTALSLLEEKSITNYKNLLNGVELLVIDEAQNIPDIGHKLKLIVDEIEGIKVVASGSSSFDLLNKAGEPLTGRSFTYRLYPFSQQELSAQENLLETTQNLDIRLIYGSYPEVISITSNIEKQEYLYDLVNSYLLKDILTLDGLRNSAKIRDLLTLLAYQTGNEVSNTELGKQLSLSKNTVEKYLDLLSKVFVIYKLSAYSGNLRKEISKGAKWYFWDNGIRNALIGNFNPLSIRQDTGILWENYVISERIKKTHNQLENKRFYFWRTYDRQEIDLIESTADKLEAYEMKWKERKIKVPEAWKKTYPEAEFRLMHPLNYLDWIR
jgi:predicted AAA+ superfamily ATPase